MASVADLIGEPARAAMLLTLMDGRALTASELASTAGVGASTASEHLSRMREAGLIALLPQGRHRYYQLANPAVAEILEGLLALSDHLDATRATLRRVGTGPRDVALRRARICYDHLAGHVAVSIADSMIGDGYLELGSDGGRLTPSGARRLAALGVLTERPGERTEVVGVPCRAYLDWSVRRHHIGGHLGRCILSHLLHKGWARRRAEGRAVEITPSGLIGIRRDFGADASG